MSYQSAYTGSQIDEAVRHVQGALYNGTTDLVSTTALNSRLSSYSTTAQMNSAINTSNTAQFPVGSVYITSTNATPGTYLGGTWTLIDKQLARAQVDAFTPTLGNSSTASVEGHVGGHMVHLVFSFTTKNSFSDANGSDIITINPNKFGCSGWLTYRITHFSDGGDVLLQMNLTSTGVLSIIDMMYRGNSNSTLAARAFSTCARDIYVPYNYLLDSWCDQFVWKRTA